MILHNKTICITGGGGGLGLEIVKKLLPFCKVVYVIDRIEQSYFSDKIIYMKMDLLVDKPVFDVEFDVFISNIGINPGIKSYEEYSDREIEESMEININIHLWMFKKVKWKKFVFIASILSFQSYKGMSLYCASKSFLRSFNQSMRREGKDTLIIYPCKINTGMFKEIKDYMVVEAEYVAEKVVEGIRKDKMEVYVPGYLRYLNYLFLLFPEMVADYLCNKIMEIFHGKNKRDLLYYKKDDGVYIGLLIIVFLLLSSSYCLLISPITVIIFLTPKVLKKYSISILLLLKIISTIQET